MKQINAGVLLKSAFYGLKMAQHTVYCLKSSWTLLGRWWRIYDHLAHIHVMRWRPTSPSPRPWLCLIFICWSRLIIQDTGTVWPLDKTPALSRTILMLFTLRRAAAFMPKCFGTHSSSVFLPGSQKCCFSPLLSEVIKTQTCMSAGCLPPYQFSPPFLAAQTRPIQRK